jgi:xanthine/uracil permease
MTRGLVIPFIERNGNDDVPLDPKSAEVLQQGGVIAPDERLSWPVTAVMGVQHVIAMFGATVLAPLLMGFDPNIAVLMSGIGTLIFFLITGGKVPSYLGSSFAFIGVVVAATGYAGQGVNEQIGLALGGIMACRAFCALIGVVVQAIGTDWIERFMPPVVTDAVMAVIGLNLAGIPVKNRAASNFDAWMQAATFGCVGLAAVMTRGIAQRMLILVGLIAASVLYALFAKGLGMGHACCFFQDLPRLRGSGCLRSLRQSSMRMRSC